MRSTRPQGLPQVPSHRIIATAGPSKVHPFSPEDLAFIESAAAQSHRGGFAKELTGFVNNGVRRAMGIELDDATWHEIHTKGGTEGMEKAVLAGCLPEGKTVLVNTDNFSGVALSIIQQAQRPVETMDFERGDGLEIDSPEFEVLAGRIESGEIDTVYFTENGTTTGVNQRAAIEELVRRRDAAGSHTVFIVDGVSTDIVGAERNNLADAFFFSDQKDMAAGGVGKGVLLVNDRFVERARAVEETGVYIGGKATVLSDIKKGGNQSITTPSMAGLAREALILGRLRGADSEDWRGVAQMQAAARSMLEEATSTGELADMGFSMLAKPSLRSHTSHVLRVPDGVDASMIVSKLATDHNISISGGYGRANKPKELRPCLYSANTMVEAEEIAEGIAAVTRAIRA